MLSKSMLSLVVLMMHSPISSQTSAPSNAAIDTSNCFLNLFLGPHVSVVVMQEGSSWVHYCFVFLIIKR